MYIDERSWGRAAFSRACRDGTLALQAHGRALPVDIAAAPRLRALAVAASLPHGTCLTGATALWLAGWRTNEPPPPWTTLAVRRGSHPKVSARVPRPVTWMTDHEAASAALAASPAGAPPRVANDYACAAALAYEPESQSLPAVAWALRHSGVTRRAVEGRIARLGSRDARQRAGRLLALLAAAQVA